MLKIAFRAIFNTAPHFFERINRLCSLTWKGGLLPSQVDGWLFLNSILLETNVFELNWREVALP